MTETTEAIILHATKYGDGKFMLNAYSRRLGRTSFALSIPAAKNRPSPLPCCQPLFQNEIEYAGGDSLVKRVKSISPSYNYVTIPKSPVKTSVVMFLSEVLLKTLTYPECNPDLYGFISTSLKILDDKNFKGRNFHLKFLLQFLKYSGFYPADGIKGCSAEHSKIFSALLGGGFLECEEIELNGSGRSLLLEKILDCYRCNFPAFKEIKSLEILKTVFH